MVACLRTPDLAGAVENWAGLLNANPGFRTVCGFGNRPPFSTSRNPLTLTDIEPLLSPLFLEGMKSNVVCDMAFEEFVTDIRRHLLDQFSKEKEGRFPHERYIVLASALSHYVFFTDFILEETRHEEERIGALRRRIEAGTAVTAAAIALLACYRPLYALSNADDILETFKNTSILSEVVKAQISDHEALRQVAVSIPALSSVADKTSLHVREQYEAFPYPRWKTLWKRQIIENWRDEEFCQRLEAPLANRPASILIAGCGTGRDAAIHSMRFPLSSITAVDVSRTSLAYASIKTKELGLGNITFMHGDILDLGRVGQTFDYICCTGVLHHMENPVAGWRVLRDLQKPGGLMRIGLYSRAGRKAVAVSACPLDDTHKKGCYHFGSQPFLFLVVLSRDLPRIGRFPARPFSVPPLPRLGQDY